MNTLRTLARSLAPYEIFVAGLAVLGSMVVTDWLPWAVLVMSLFWPIRGLAWGKLSERTPVDVPLAILALLVPVNYWISPIPETSLPQLLRLLVGIGLFYALANAARPLRGRPLRGRPLRETPQPEKWLRGITWLGVGGAVALAVVSLFTVEWATNKLPFIPPILYEYTAVMVGDTIHPNVLAGTLVLLLPIPLGLLLFGGREIGWLERILLALAILIVAGFMVLSQSRGAVLAMGGAVALLVLLRWRWGWIGVGVGALLSAGVVWRVGWARLLDMILVGTTLSGGDGRFQIWQRALYMIQDFPFTGIGMGLFGDVAAALYPFPGRVPGVEPRFMPHAHQLFLQVAVDMGIPGLAAWLAVFVGVLVAGGQIYRLARQQEQRWLMGLVAGLLAAQVALTVHGLLDAVTWGMVRPAPVVWGLWGGIILCRAFTKNWV